MTDQISKRRRGVVLEDAILDAAWQELEHSGYNNFSYEAVAKRGMTSRPVLYRRWDTRLRLASAGIRHHMKRNPITVPDLGNVRDELKVLLRRFADRTPPRLTRLLFDMAEDMANEQMSFTDDDPVREPLLQPVLERAVARGEILKTRLTPRLMRVPTSLVLHESIVTQRPVTDSAIEEIIDGIFLPLILAKPHQS